MDETNQKRAIRRITHSALVLIGAQLLLILIRVPDFNWPLPQLGWGWTLTPVWIVLLFVYTVVAGGVLVMWLAGVPAHLIINKLKRR